MAPTPKTAAPAAAPGVVTKATAKKSTQKPGLTKQELLELRVGLGELSKSDPRLAELVSKQLKKIRGPKDKKPRAVPISVFKQYQKAQERLAVALGKIEAGGYVPNEQQRTIMDQGMACLQNPEQTKAAFQEAQQQTEAAKEARKQALRAEYEAAAARLQQADEESAEEPPEGPATEDEPDDEMPDFDRGSISDSGSESDSEDVFKRPFAHSA